MNGIHDLGGMHGFGPIEREEGEPVFHNDWERRTFALTNAIFASGLINVDEFRHAIEGMGAANYLETTYYEHWLHACEELLVAKGVLSRDELTSRQAALGAEDAS